MHADRQSTFASVSKWNSGKVKYRTSCENKMRTVFTEFWKLELNVADLRSVPKNILSTYKQFKNKFALENYI